MRLTLILLLLFSTTLYADELYLIENTDGSVRVLRYDEGSRDTLQDVLESIGADGLPVNKITPADLPINRTDRKYWKKLGKKVVIDTVKKSEDEATEQAKELERDAVLSKLKITKEEYEKLNDKRTNRTISF